MGSSVTMSGSSNPQRQHASMEPRHEQTYRIGNRIVSRATYFRHLQQRREEIHSNPSSSDKSSSESSRSLESLNEDTSTPSTHASSEDIPSERSGRFPLPISPISSSHVSPGIADLGVDMWQSGVGFVEGQIPSPTHEAPSLPSVIEDEVIGLQSILDRANVPLSVQDEVLQRLFKKVPHNEREEPKDYTKMGIVQLIGIAGKTIY